MNRRIYYYAGLLAPFLFIFTAILGGALRPGYNHLTDTISELFSPGSPNRFLLTTLHTTFALGFSLFGVGLLRFVQSVGKFKTIGVIAAADFILVGVLNILTATVFPQDARGSMPTFYGEMHILISGVLSIFSILYMILFGVWFYRTRIASFFLTYSIVTIIGVILSAAWFMASYGGPLMGLAERVTALVGFQWTVLLAITVLKND